MQNLDPNDLKSWPYQEAKKLLKSRKNREAKPTILFQTGFGPSGLPHIGTFAEVARTTWVRQAYEQITGEKTLLYAFSDDMDGLRKVPDNIPNKELIAPHLGKPLCDIPDPFGEYDSYSAYMNAKLKGFLDGFGFEYEFKASHTQYRTGIFNDGLVRILQNYEKIRNVILPTLSPQKRVGWSPFMPICEKCGLVNSTTVTGTFPARDSISYACDQGLHDEKTGWGYQGCGHQGEVSVKDGNVKAGWKVDWALRWFTFGIDYEMYGKDLIDSAKLSSKICRILEGTPPAGMFYEMFLDKDEHKISKSIGNGLTIDEWLQYGPLESLALFIFNKPSRANRLYFDVIPKYTDEYLKHLKNWKEAGSLKRAQSPLRFVHKDNSGFSADLSFGLLLHLVNALNTNSKELVWSYVLQYCPEAKKDFPLIDLLIDRALSYFQDFVLPTKVYKAPSEEMQPVVDSFLQWLREYGGEDGVEIQNTAYAIAKEAGVNLRAFFQTMYELLLGQSQGPRLGSFIQLFGVQDTLKLVENVDRNKT